MSERRENPYPPGSTEADAYEAGRAAARSARGLGGEESRAWRRGFATNGGGPGDPDAGHVHDFDGGPKCITCDKTRVVAQAERDAYHRGWLARDVADDDYLDGYCAGKDDFDGNLADRVYRELNPGQLLDWDPDAPRWREAVARALSIA